MNINDSMIPEELMNNVEGKLRKHLQQKNKKRKIYSIAFAITFALIVPTSVLAYNNHVKSIPYKQEIDLAREHKDTYKIDKSFKYKDIEFKFKEILADETGIMVIYDVSNPDYYISSINVRDKDNSWLGDYGYSLPGTLDSETERSFHISGSKDVIAYMKDNPIIININKIDHLQNQEKSFFTKLKDLIIKEKNMAVDWTIKAQIPLQEIRSFKLDKEMALDIGTLKLTTFKEGILNSYVNYAFTPSDKNITLFNPVFSIRMDDEYYNRNMFASIPMENSIELKSIYYKKPKEISLKLIGAQVSYSNGSKKEYTIDKNKLPAEYEFNGDKFTLISAKDKGSSIEYSFEFDSKNRTIENMLLSFNTPSKSEGNFGRIQFKDQEKRDEVYNSLTSKIPDIKDLYKENHLDEGLTKIKYEVEDKNCNTFTIDTYEKTFLYNSDEYIIKTENLK